jgi:serine/threonine protein kinase
MSDLIQPAGGEESGEAPSLLTPEELAPHFPQLEILACLGRGGMGVVYKARQISLNRLVALKLLAPERTGDARFAERFEREAKALAALNHPHIVGIHDFGLAGGSYFLLMEYVDGMNLRQLLESKRLTPAEALRIVPPVCGALQCAHDHGIVHRDIKPENILIDKAGVVKIADFGIAKMVHGGTAAPPGDSLRHPPGAEGSLLFGTPAYAAPEQAGGAEADHRADLYSLGVVLYEMLTGTRPGDIPVPPSRQVEMDARIDRIVLRALEKSPCLRFETATAFRTQVESVVNESGAAESIPPRLLDASPCYLSLMEEPGAQPVLSRRKAQVQLYEGHLSFIRDGGVSVIPLSAIRDLSVGRYSRSVNPAGLDFISVSYEENGRAERILFSPSAGLFAWPSHFNQFVARWVRRIREAVTDVTGVAPASIPAAALGAPRGERRTAAWIVGLLLLGVLLGAMYLVRKLPPPPPPSHATPVPMQAE